MSQKELTSNDTEKLHFFTHSTDGITLPSVFTYPFHYTPHPLTQLAAREVQAYLSERKEWEEELHQGKMFGVLVVRTPDNRTGYLAAFSGNLAGSNSHPFFVPPVYDLLQPDGFFRLEEAQISQINTRIRELEQASEYQSQKKELLDLQETGNRQLTAAKEAMRQAKQAREKLRAAGVSPETEAQLIKESQFQKAEYKRLEKRIKNEIDTQAVLVHRHEALIRQLKEERKHRSAALQLRLFQQFQMLNAKGEHKDLCQIFQDTPQGTPPAGAGECALPKLLQYAYQHQLYPLAMGEFWWGMSPKEEIRHHGHFYPSCKGKCAPILAHMLIGLNVEKNPLEVDCHKDKELEIVYEDEWIVAVNKPAGMLSVPGKNDLDSVCQRLQRLYPQATGPLVVHRLDMATSGILLAAKTKEVHQQLQALFATRQMEKQYTAILQGYHGNDEGDISLPLMPDWNNRPCQMVHPTLGKPALTHFRVIKRQGEKVWVTFWPHTGRTHQLRVHAAHAEGLNAPIAGDELYGTKDKRLYLHASYLSFVHPVTGKKVEIRVPAPFL